MSDSWEQYGRRVISGEACGLRAGLMRAGLSVVSPIYAMAMRGRNWKFDRGIGVGRLPRPVVSVGNITTGGTGKTPVVRWLCERLRDAGGRPAVLMRGYKAKAGERGDEQLMLESLLNRPDLAPVTVHAEPSRHAGGLAVLARDPSVDVFVMDDGFQHRRLARDFDLVLIDASEPLGYGHVLPRGLLREPPVGLRRADAILITHADQAADVDRVVQLVRRHNPDAPVYRCSHALVGLRSADGALRPLDELAGRRSFGFAGIGNPEAFGRQLAQFPGELAGTKWFADHWAYSAADVDAVFAVARRAGATDVVTTEKDWVKCAALIDAAAGALPVWRAELAIRFEGQDESRLFDQIRERLRSGRP